MILQVVTQLKYHLLYDRQMICEMGKRAEAVYFVKTGSVLVTPETKPEHKLTIEFKQEPVALLQTGSFFGERSILFDQPLDYTYAVYHKRQQFESKG